MCHTNQQIDFLEVCCFSEADNDWRMGQGEKIRKCRPLNCPRYAELDDRVWFRGTRSLRHGSMPEAIVSVRSNDSLFLIVLLSWDYYFSILERTGRIRRFVTKMSDSNIAQHRRSSKNNIPKRKAAALGLDLLKIIWCYLYWPFWLQCLLELKVKQNFAFLKNCLRWFQSILSLRYFPPPGPSVMFGWVLPLHWLPTGICLSMVYCYVFRCLTAKCHTVRPLASLVRS